MMRKLYFFIFIIPLLASCIQDAPQNPEADILTFAFPSDSVRIPTSQKDIYNTYIVSYPKEGVNLSSLANTPVLTVTPGATWKRIDKGMVNDTLFYIEVIAEDKSYSKIYAITQVAAFPDHFTFDTWVKYSPYYLYENPKDQSFQWFSSNNGAATAFGSSTKPASDYPVRKTSGLSGGFVVELQTMKGPGKVGGGIRYIPCLAGSLYLGGFNILNALRDPLTSTLFGAPFDRGKPLMLHGYYQYIRGEGPFITGTSEANYHEDYSREDQCDIYAILFETNNNMQFLDGNTVSQQSYWVAKAQIPNRSYTEGTDFQEFNVPFVYYKDFDWNKLISNRYKMAVVFTSATRGAYYEGRVGNRLIVDNVNITYEENNTGE